MSNLSDIGFPTRSEQDINDMISHCLELTETIRCPQGFYLKFADPSGAEIWLQGNEEQELIGFNPHFTGKSRRRVQLMQAIERESSALDGGFHALANTSENLNGPGVRPFVFDAPDFRLNEILRFPHVCEIQLTAFASNDFKIHAARKEHTGKQEGESEVPAKSFVADGLSPAEGESETVELSGVRPIAKVTGEIREVDLKKNQLSGNEFYSFLIDTFGGEIDVVADVNLVADQPKAGDIVSGHFWLSGKITQ